MRDGLKTSIEISCLWGWAVCPCLDSLEGAVTPVCALCLCPGLAAAGTGHGHQGTGQPQPGRLRVVGQLQGPGMSPTSACGSSADPSAPIYKIQMGKVLHKLTNTALKE